MSADGGGEVQNTGMHRIKAEAKSWWWWKKNQVEKSFNCFICFALELIISTDGEEVKAFCRIRHIHIHRRFSKKKAKKRIKRWERKKGGGAEAKSAKHFIQCAPIEVQSKWNDCSIEAQCVASIGIYMAMPHGIQSEHGKNWNIFIGFTMA